MAYFTQFKALSEEFNPQNTRCNPPVKFFFRLELEQTNQFSNSLLDRALKSFESGLLTRRKMSQNLTHIYNM
jgi:hypothetical protein